MMEPIGASGARRDRAASQPTAHSAGTVPSLAEQKLDSLKLAWRESRFLRDEPVVGVLEENLTTLIQVFGAERLAAILPNPKLRPLAAGAVVMELAHANLAPDDFSSIHLTKPSKTLAILNAPYQPTFMSDILPTLQTADFKREAQVALGEALCECLIPSTANGGLNSTLKNLLLAVRLNETVLKTTKIKASIQRAQYTWEGLNAKVSPQYDLPSLPGQTAKDSAVKLVVSLIEDGKVVDHCDYGQSEGSERYGVISSGEGLEFIAGTPQCQPADLTRLTSIVDALSSVSHSHERPQEREAIRRMGQHRKIIRFVTDFGTMPNAITFPRIIGSVADLSADHVREVLTLSHMLKEMDPNYLHSIGRRNVAGNHGTLLSMFSGSRALIVFTQPSTRTKTAAVDAAYALGLSHTLVEHTSKEKGEGIVSESVTLATHGVDVVLARDAKFEQEAAALTRRNDNDPVRVSLGGNLFHPSQTLAELQLFMEVYGCQTFSLDELRRNTKGPAPTITFIGLTAQKRADKALISLILEHLPHWRVRVIVPREQDLPTELKIPPGALYEARCVPNLLDKETVRREVQGTTWLYASNAEATSRADEKGTGQGKGQPLVKITPGVLDEIDLGFLHPLPDGGELDPAVFDHPKSYIGQQMSYKPTVIAALVALALQAKKTRAALH